MKHPFYEWLVNQNLANEADILSFEKEENEKPFSLFREVNFLLYAGVLILAAGLGILVYKNLDTIGHLILIVLIFLVSVGSLVYSNLRYPKFSLQKTEAPDLFFPYLVLLGVSFFMLWEGYIEYQYQIFGDYKNVLTLFAALVCFLAAYRFDHEGVLSIGLATLVTSIGLTILPQKWFLGGINFNEPLFIMGAIMGLIFILFGFLLSKRGIKSHFETTYVNVGGFLLLACLLGLQFDAPIPWFGALILVICYGLFLYAKQLKNLSLYVLVVFAGYVAFSNLYYSVFSADFFGSGILYYVPLSLAVVGYLFVNYKRFLKISK